MMTTVGCRHADPGYVGHDLRISPSDIRLPKTLAGALDVAASLVAGLPVVREQSVPGPDTSLIRLPYRRETAQSRPFPLHGSPSVVE